MSHITNYKDFKFLYEKREASAREKITTGKKIEEFLKKSKYTYKPGSDSNVFVSFKTGKFESFIPPRNTDGVYKSPQGFYCFDMNMFKKRMFGDEEVSGENFNPINLKKSDDIISELGLGFANNNTNVADDGIDQFGFPRYLYLVRLKEGYKVLSRLSGRIKVEDPVKNLLRYYSHYFMKSDTSSKFDPKNKQDIGRLTLKEMLDYFKKKSNDLKEDIYESLIELIESVLNDKEDLHKIVYYFIKSFSETFGENKMFVRFTLICNSIGIDGFTQRKADGGFIHNTPDFQTLLLSRKSVDEIIIIDLIKDIRNDKYVSLSKDPEEMERIKKGKETGHFGDKNYRLPEKINKEKQERVISFMKQLKKGDFVKITAEKLDRLKKGYITMICQVIEPIDENNEIATKGVNLVERYNWSFNYDYNQFGFEKGAPRVDFKRPKPEYRPLITPFAVNGPDYAYWCYRKKEFEKSGISWEEYISKLPERYDSPSDKVLKSLDDLINKNDTYITQDIRPSIDINRLIAFSNSYLSAIHPHEGARISGPMTLSVYRGDLNKPIKVLRTEMANDIIK